MKRAVRSVAATAVAACIIGVPSVWLAYGAGVRGQVRRVSAPAGSRHRNPVCPARAAPIPRSGFERGAGRAAQYFMTHVPRSQFPGDAKRVDHMDRGSRVTSEIAVSKSRFWSDATRLLCGSVMIDRTVVVGLSFPHSVGSGELGILFVMRKPGGGYTVYYVWHA